MAQYRAIFQNAYFKGLATAAVVTMGLAAGQAQAAAIDSADAWGKLNGLENKVEGSETITLSGSGITNDNAFKLEISSSGSHVIKSGSVTASNAEIVYNNSTPGTGSITIQTDTDAGILDVNKFTLTQGTVNISGSGSALKAGTLEIGGEAVEDGKATITLASGAFVGNSGSNATDFNTELTLNKGAKITTSGDSSGSIYAAKLTMNDGAISTSGSSATATLTLNVNKGEINGGTLEAGKSGSLAINLTKLGETVGDVNIKKGDIKVASGSTLTISGEGNLSIADAATFSGDAEAIVSISGGATGPTVKLSKAQLKEIVDASKLTLTSGTISLTDAFDLATDIKLADAAAAGSMKADSGSVFAGADITVSKKIDSGSNITVNADKLTLGSASFDGKEALGFSGASAKSGLVFVNNSGSDAFTLKDSVSVKNVDASGAALTGTISGNVKLDTDNKNLTVAGGKYTYEGDITVGSGSLLVNAGADANESSLAVSGTITLDRTSNKSGTITVSGSNATHVASIDLTSATLKYGTDSGDKVEIVADKHATVKIGGTQLTDLIGVKEASGAVFDTKSGGTLLVDGDITLTNKQISGSGLNKGIQLASGGLVKVDGQLVLNNSGDDSFSLFDAGAKLKAQSLDVINANLKSGSTLQSGNFTFTQNLNTNSEVGFVVESGAAIQLGDFTQVAKDVYASESAAGNISQNLELKADGVNVNVVAGDWTAQQVKVTSGSLTVGQADKDAKVDAKGDAIKSSLTVSDLVVAKESGSTVTKQGSLTATTIDLSSGSVQVSGDMTILGRYQAATTGDKPTNESFGIKLKDNAIALGEGATLTLGAEANHALGLAGVTGEVKEVKAAADTFNTSGSITGDKFSTVKLTLGSDVSFTADGLKSLKAALFGDAGTSGTISLGDATIAGLQYGGTEEDPTLDWSTITEDQKLVLPNIEDEKLKKTTIEISNGETVLGNVGAIKGTGISKNQAVSVTDHGSLNSADVVAGQTNKLFAYNEKGEVLGLDIAAGVNYKLVNGGEAGNVKLGSGTSLLVDGGSANGKTILADLTGKTSDSVIVAGDLDVNGKLELNKVESKEGTTLTVAKNATLAGISTLAGKTVVAGTLTAENAFTSTGDLQVTGKTTFKDVATIAGQNTVLADVDFSGAANLAGQNITLGVATFKADSTIAKGQTFAADIKLGNGVDLVVGTEPVQGNAALANGASATLVTDKLSLADGELYIDQNFEVESSIVVAGQLSGTSLSADDAGTLDGKALVLQNGILGIGLDTTNKDLAKAQVKKELAPLFKDNGALDESKIGAVAYTVKKVTLGAGDQLVVDSKKTVTSYKANPVTQALYLGEKSALAIDGKAFEGTQAPITLQDSSAVYAGKDAKVLLTGSNVVAQVKGKKLFDGTGLTLEGYAAAGSNPVLRVETINGWFTQDLTDLSAQLGLVVNATKMQGDLAGVSAPVADTLMSVAYGMHNYAQQGDNGFVEKTVYGELAEGIVKDADGNFYFGKKNDNGTNKVNDQALLDRLAKATVTDNGAVYFAPENELIDNIVYNNGSAIDAETNARLAVFGGAPQAAIEAGASTYEAISARMGVGVSGVSAAANGQGGAIWVTPVYKSAESDGFAADNKSYGADVKLYGLALGADIEVAPNFKVGGMFNVGSGDADGQGLGSNVSNDFDYYGLGLYAGYSMDAFSLVADVTYTAVDNDIEGNTDLGKVNASIDSTNISVGVTGQYKLSVAGMDVTPHAGLRYSMIDMDDYSTAYSQNDSDSINIFSLPVGVTIAKEYVSDTWTVKPSFDLTLTGNFGDDEVDTTAKWNGFSNLSTTVKSEIMDNFTYGAAVGVSATSGNFGLGLGINYTGSSNTDEFGVNANARYMF